MCVDLGAWREWCGNLDREKKLYGGLWALNVEDHPHKLPHVRGAVPTQRATWCHFGCGFPHGGYAV